MDRGAFSILWEENRPRRNRRQSRPAVGRRGGASSGPHANSSELPGRARAAHALARVETGGGAGCLMAAHPPKTSDPAVWDHHAHFAWPTPTPVRLFHFLHTPARATFCTYYASATYQALNPPPNRRERLSSLRQRCLACARPPCGSCACCWRSPRPLSPRGRT